MTDLVRATRSLHIISPLGPDVLELKTATGEECISGLFSYTLELLSPEDAIDLAKLTGKAMTVVLPRPDGSEQYLHGIVTRFAYVGSSAHQTTYHAELRPEIWTLTHSSNCRIFQNKTVEQIVEQVLHEAGITSLSKRLSGSYKAREFCVQYRESSFDFLSRLMQEEGIFYFFQHESGKHILVLADNAGAHPESSPKTIRWRPAQAAWADEETIFECTLEEQPVTEKCRISDYNFEMPETGLFSVIGPEGAKQEFYEYPGDALTIDELDAKAKRTLESLTSGRRVLRGQSACRVLRPGVRFNFRGHSRNDLNADYIVRRVSFRAEPNGSYTSSFDAYPADVTFRPARTSARPRIYGAQTATVVGKPGDETLTDKYGRVRVHFHWDRRSQKNETASCPVRVAQVCAGKKYGSVFVPRVGQEVVVSFLDGNPDRPIIIGSVYNAAQPPPYDPSAETTRTGFKSKANEIGFEDKKDSEELYFRAHKDCGFEIGNDAKLNIGHDQRIAIKNGRTVTIGAAADSLTIAQGNREIKVDTGNETHSVGGSRALTVGGAETHDCKADYTLNVDGNFTLRVKGNITIETEDGTITIKGKAIDTVAKQALHHSAATILNEAEQTLTNKSGISQNVEGAVSVTIKGAMVKIN